MEHLDVQLRPATSRGCCVRVLPVNGHLPALLSSVFASMFLSSDRVGCARVRIALAALYRDLSLDQV